MGFRDRLQDKALRAGTEALRKTATSIPAQMAGDGLRGFRSMLDGGDESLSVEFFLLSLVRAVRSDELDDDRSQRQVYVTARKRRRRLGFVAFAFGPLAGFANQVADLYCEAGVVCDLADFHGLELTDDQAAAHMLVLWEVADDLETARRAVAGEPPVADLLFDQIDGRLPEELTRWSIAKALWEVRADVENVGRGGTVQTVAFTGFRTKKVIKRIEAQMGVGS